MSYGADQDEELAELQRRFMALEDEARVTMEKTMTTPRHAGGNRTQRERTAAANVRSDNEQELAKLDEQITQLRRKHDDLAHANLEKRRELDKLNDRLQACPRPGSAALGAPGPAPRLHPRAPSPSAGPLARGEPALRRGQSRHEGDSRAGGAAEQGGHEV